MAAARQIDRPTDHPSVGLVLEYLRERDELDGQIQARPVGNHSNEVIEVRLASDRAVIVKEGRHDWARQRFAKSRDVSRTLSERDDADDIVVPRPFPLPMSEEGPPVQAYWRIPLPTLDYVWHDLNDGQRAEAMRSWGRLLARLHRVRVSGWGDSWRDSEPQSLESFLQADIGERLLPACYGIWEPAVPAAHRLLDSVPAAADGIQDDDAVLAHNDQHMGNVLCEYDGESVRCVGFLDLEAAIAAPPECDLASLEVLHGPHFEQRLDTRWPAEARAGYGRAPDARRLRFFRAMHLLNLGFYSALIGHREHAAIVLGSLEAEVARLD